MTPHHSNIGVWLRWVTELGSLTLLLGNQKLPSQLASTLIIPFDVVKPTQASCNSLCDPMCV